MQAEGVALPIAIEEDDTLVVIRGANLQIVDGSGDTAGPVNGRGNLVIGYNENSPAPKDRSGSHDLIIGSDHSCSVVGGGEGRTAPGLTNWVAGSLIENF